MTALRGGVVVALHCVHNHSLCCCIDRVFRTQESATSQLSMGCGADLDNRQRRSAAYMMRLGNRYIQVSALGTVLRTADPGSGCKIMSTIKKTTMMAWLIWKVWKLLIVLVIPVSAFGLSCFR